MKHLPPHWFKPVKIPIGLVFIDLRMPRTPMLRLIVNNGRSAVNWREYD